MTKDMQSLFYGEVLEEDVELTLADLCRTCHLPAERVIELVEEGIIEPRGNLSAHWRFNGLSVYRVRCALRLERDLGVNLAGAALAIELLDELQQLRIHLDRFEG